VFADENETTVDSGGASQEPAKTAEIESAASSPPSSPGAAIGAPQETPVSLTKEQVLAMIEEQVSTARAEIEDVRATLRAAIDETRAMMDRYLQTAAVSAPTIEKPASTAASHVLAVGDPVRIYKDADRKTFYTGTVTALHEGGPAADVSINELEGALTTARLDSLEYDDRA
jgi:hypothetical protein